MIQLALLLALVGVPFDSLSVVRGSGGAGGGTDYTANGAFYELWDFNGTVGTAQGSGNICDGAVHGRHLAQSGTPVRSTTTGVVEGAAAMDNTNGPNGCQGSLPSEAGGNPDPPTGSWTTGMRFYPTEGPTFIQKILSVNGNGVDFNLQANTTTQADWVMGGSTINNQHIFATGTQYSVVVHYDGADLSFWWNGGSGGDCAGSNYASALDPPDITSIEVGNAQGGDWGGLVDELFFTGQAFTQTDACNYHQDGIDGAGLP